MPSTSVLGLDHSRRMRHIVVRENRRRWVTSWICAESPRTSSGGVAKAEDLVQNTFLAANETAERWQSEDPLFPWLLGILTNKERTHRVS